MNQHGLKKVRSQVAGFSLALIIASLFAVSVAQAATFADVQPSAWYYPYVEDLAAKGILDTTKTNYLPGSEVNRAEMAKLVVQAFNLKLVTPTAAPFKDVQLGQWYTPYIATAVQNGIVSGYKDNTGVLTGFFGPADSLTRDQATKIIDLSAPLTTNIQNGPHFSDVPASLWSYQFVETAYNWSIVDGYSNGKFGPNDHILRAQVAKIVDNALKPINRTGTSTQTTQNGTQVYVGSVSVQLNSGSPASQNIPCNANSLTFAKFNVGAGAAAAQVNSITFKRVGLGNKNDFSKVWIEDSNGNRLTARQTVGTDDYLTLAFSPSALTINANSSVVLSLVAQMNAVDSTTGACLTGRSDAFEIENAASVSTNGGSVGGTFPVLGYTMTTANYSAAKLDGVIAGSDATYQVGELNQEFAQWKLQNTDSSKDMLVKTLTIKNEGTGRIATDLANLNIAVNGTVISTSVTTNGEYATFNLNNYVLPAGRTDTFYIRADVVGMDSTTTDTIQFDVRYPEDINAVEATTGFGVNQDLTTNITTSTAHIYSIQGGDTTFVKSTTAPNAQTKPAGATAVTLLDSNLIVKQDFTTDALNVNLFSSLTGTASVIQAGLTNDLKNLKLYVDGTLVQTLSGNNADFSACVADSSQIVGGSVCVLDFDSTVTLKAGTRDIKLVADIQSNATAGDKFRALITGVTNAPVTGAFLTPTYIANDRTIAPVAGTVTGGDVTIGSSTLTIAENSGYTANQQFVSGAQNLSVAKYKLSANDSDDITITNLTFALYDPAANKVANAVAYPAPLVGTCAKAAGCDVGVNGSDLTSASVYVNGVQTGSTRSFGTGTAATVSFTDVNFKVPSNGQATVELKVSMTNSASGLLNVNMSGINAEDSNSNNATISPEAPNTNTPPNAGYQSPQLWVVSSGTLNVTGDQNTVGSQYYNAMQTNVELGSFAFDARYDDVQIQSIFFRTVKPDGVTPIDVATSLSAVKLYDTDGTTLLATGNVYSDITNGYSYIKFTPGSSSKFIIHKGETGHVVHIKADLNDVPDSTRTLKPFKLVLATSVTLAAADVTGTTGIDPTINLYAVSSSNNNQLTTVGTSLTVAGSATPPATVALTPATNAVAITKSTLSIAQALNSTYHIPAADNGAQSGKAASVQNAYAFTVTNNSTVNSVELGSIGLTLSGSGSPVIGTYAICGVDSSNNADCSSTNTYASGTATLTVLGTNTTYAVAFNNKKLVVAPGKSATLIVQLNATLTAGSSLNVSVARGPADNVTTGATLSTFLGSASAGLLNSTALVNLPAAGITTTGSLLWSDESAIAHTDTYSAATTDWFTGYQVPVSANQNTFSNN